MSLSGFATGESQIHIYQLLRPLTPRAAQLGVVVQQDLPFGHSTNGGSVSVVAGDEDCIDI